VTSFHVVAAASNPNARLHVFSTAAGLDRPAKVVRVLKSADLALLEVDQSLGLPSLQSNNSNPSFAADLVAFGHPLFTPTVQRQFLKFDKEEELQDITPLNANEAITRLGFPRLSDPVFGLMGPLVPGHSGAPIIDHDGKVVAIGDGGLERGAASISWAIPARKLTMLLSSNDTLAFDNNTLSAIEILFAADLNPNIVASPSGAQPVLAGPVKLRKTRTRTLGEMRRSLTSASDDPLGLLQLIQFLISSGVPYNPDELTFDIYQDDASGMNLVLPTGIALRLDGDTLVGQSEVGMIEWFVWARHVSSLQEAYQLSIPFEGEILSHYQPMNWQLDLAGSYPTPRTTPDGMVVTRKHLSGYPFASQPGYALRRVLYETFATKGGYFLSAGVIRTGGVEPGTTPQNDPVWASAILGIHLSSFSR